MKRNDAQVNKKITSANILGLQAKISIIDRLFCWVKVKPFKTDRRSERLHSCIFGAAKAQIVLPKKILQLHIQPLLRYGVG